MSRHRNVRSMNYSDEYDGYDDVYGHSVEDEYCISPSEAGFIYDRTRQPQMSAFLDKENDIQEEDEDIERDFKKPHLNDLDEARLRSCLEEINSIIGDTVPQCVIEETILKNNFDITVTLDKILNGNESQTQSTRIEPPKPQRELGRRRDRGNRTAVIETNEVTPSIKIVPPGTNVVKGFDIASKEDENKPLSNFNSPRCQSPISGRTTPINDQEDGDAADKRPKMETPGGTTRTPARNRESKVDVESQYKQDRGQSKEQLHMVVIGHVDAGKSTLMGHLLFALGQVNKRTMHKYEQESKKIGKQSFLYAWILDETGEERSRGITMDVGQSKFETKTKTVTLLDAPGHKDFIPNMITGATQADVALLVVDATRGEFETGFESGGQTREHALLVRSLGVNQLAVVVNKLDTVNWSQDRFNEITKKLGSFLRQAGFRESDVSYVPCSGLAGQNLVEKPNEEALLSWYSGPTLIEVIDNFTSPQRPIAKPFRMSVNDVYKGTGSGFCVSGRVETGMVQVGDKSLVMPQNETALVKGITIDDLPVQTAYAGDQISVTLSNYDMENINVGYILCDGTNSVPTTTKFEARIVVFNISVPITQGFPVVIHSQSLSEQAVITKLVAQLHKSSGEVVKRRPRCLVRNSNAVVQIETSRPICLELYRDIKELGRFMLRVGGVSIAAGLVTKIF